MRSRRPCASAAGSWSSATTGVSPSGLVAAEIGEIAFEHGICLHELSPQSASLEEAFFALTGEDTSFRGQPATVHEGASR